MSKFITMPEHYAQFSTPELIKHRKNLEVDLLRVEQDMQSGSLNSVTYSSKITEAHQKISAIDRVLKSRTKRVVIRGS